MRSSQCKSMIRVIYKMYIILYIYIEIMHKGEQEIMWLAHGSATTLAASSQRLRRKGKGCEKEWKWEDLGRREGRSLGRVLGDGKHLGHLLGTSA